MILSPTEKPQEARCLQTVAIHIWSMAKVPKVFPNSNSQPKSDARQNKYSRDRCVVPCNYTSFSRSQRSRYRLNGHLLLTLRPYHP
jgi:hypothetical protein